MVKLVYKSTFHSVNFLVIDCLYIFNTIAVINFRKLIIKLNVNM